MSKIERGQFSSLLRRYLGMTGTSDVVDELAPEITAEFTLESERPEWEFLKGAKLMALANNQPANVALVSGFKIRNPAASGVIAIFDFFEISLSAASSVTLGLGTESADLATLIGSTVLDTRYGAGAVTPVSALITSRANANPGGFFFTQSAVNANLPWQLYGRRVVLTPGFELTCATGSINISLNFVAHWLEKRLDALERG